MLKLLITAAIIYGIYRFFIAPPPALNRHQQPDELKNRNHQEKEGSDEDGEYVDFEEVD